MVNLRLTEIEMDFENEKSPEESFKEDKKVLVDVIKLLFSAGLVTFGQLVNNLHEPFLQECGILGTQLTIESISKKVGESIDLPNG